MNIEMEGLKKRLFKDNKAKNIKFFPGSNADSLSEDMAREINKFFADRENVPTEDVLEEVEPE
jgi:hypothetical protein